MDAVARAGSPGIGLDVYTIAHHVDAGGRVEDVAAMLRFARTWRAPTSRRC